MKKKSVSLKEVRETIEDDIRQELEVIGEDIRQEFEEIREEGRKYAKYFWFFPVYILGFILIERFPIMQNYHVMHCALDVMIPFCEYFVIPYYLWHISILVFAIYAFRKDSVRFERLLRFFIVSCIIIFPIFVLYPSCQNMRPESFDHGGLLIWLVRFTYAADTSTNVCPSMHVMGCFGLIMTCWNMKGINGRWGHILQATLIALICLSTVFMKQHSVIDAAVAIPLSVLAWWLSDPKFKGRFKRKMKGDVSATARMLNVFKLVGILMWIAFVTVIIINWDNLNAENIASVMPDNKFLAALLIMCAFAGKSLSIIFASAVIFTTSSIVFPLPAAFCVNFLGVLVMTTIPYFIGRKGGAEVLNGICAKYHKIGEIRNKEIKSEFAFSLMLRINIAINFDLGSMYLGARGISMDKYYLGSIVGMAMPMTIYTLFGLGLSDGNYVLSVGMIVFNIMLTVVSTVFFGKRLLSKKEDKAEVAAQAEKA